MAGANSLGCELDRLQNLQLPENHTDVAKFRKLLLFRNEAQLTER